MTIGIILGFIVNEWREDLSNKRIANKSLQNIQREIASNNDQIQRIKPYYEKVLGEVDSLVKLNQQFHMTELRAWLGLNPPLLTESAYTVALSTGVLNYLGSDLAMEITKLYSLLSEFKSSLHFAINNSTIINDELSNQFLYESIINFSQYTEVFTGYYDGLEKELDEL